MTADDGSLAGYIRSIPDFPKPGIVFRDITPLLASPEGLDAAVRALAGDRARPAARRRHRARGARLSARARRSRARSARASCLARKPGNLPHDTVSANYALEYGTDALELHADAIAPGARVLVHDDLLATGGTARALCKLVEQLGGEVVGCAFLIELAFLGGRALLEPHDVHALISYDAE